MFAYFSGFALLAASISLATTCFIYLTQLLSDSATVNWRWLGAWGLSLYIEILTISTFALFISLLSRSAVFAAMSVLAFYVMARLIGFFMLMANNHVTLTSNPALFKFSTVVINGVSLLLPRFDILTQSDWLIYGVSDWQGVMWCLTAALLYVPFVLSMTIFDMVRKQF